MPGWWHGDKRADPSQQRDDAAGQGRFVGQSTSSGGAGQSGAGTRHSRSHQEIRDDRHPDHQEDPIRVHRGEPLDLPVLDDIRPSRATGHAEAAALTLLALFVVTRTPAGAAPDRRCWDNGETALLVGFAVHPLDRERVPG